METESASGQLDTVRKEERLSWPEVHTLSLGAAGVAELDLTKAIADSSFAEQIPRWLHETYKMLGGTSVARLSKS